MARAAAAGPVAEFCAALRQLRTASGADPAALARRTGLSRSQLYAVLAGEVRRPPDWDRVVRPLVEVCTGSDPAAVAAWRRRHAVLVGVAEELRRQERAAGRAGFPAPGPAAAVRFSLPPDTAAFTGRGAELAQLTAAAGGVVAVRGIGGAGKTALAVHAAHLLAGRFPDRQLFIDLCAHTPGQDPVPPQAALAGLLTAAGVEPGRLPGDLAGRAGLWRDTMVGQRAILILDNAASSAQVTPLLPGTGGCLVLVTSRRHLGDLPGPVVQVPLDVLPPGQAAEMLARLAPRAAGPGAAELAELAGGLPLAVSLLARVLARHPAWTLADLAVEARAAPLALAAENDSVAAAFSLSYQYLSSARQQFFRRLGLHPGTTADAWSAAALAGTAPQEAAGMLDGLHGEGLLTETSYRRYAMHDLIRRYARDLAASDPARDRDQAVERLLDYYQHSAASAEAVLTRSPVGPAPRPTGLPDLPDGGRALAWARAERGNLLACLDHATHTGQQARIAALTAGITTLLRHDGPWPEAITRHGAAARAAWQSGDRPGHAGALLGLGTIRRLTGDLPGAAWALQAALAISRDLDDQAAQARVLTELGIVHWQAGDLRDAAGVLEAARDISRTTGDRRQEGSALGELGVVRQLAGYYGAAAKALETALAIHRDLGDRQGQAHSLNHLGAVWLRTGDPRTAAAVAQTALGICRRGGDRLGQADALANLAGARRLAGDYPAAAEALEAALGMGRDLGDRLGQASALTGLGTIRRLTGDHSGAGAALQEALGTCRDIRYRAGQAEALSELGALHLDRADPGAARACHAQALDLARQIASPWLEASALAGLGRCALAAGDPAGAVTSLRHAWQIFRRSGAAETAGVAAELSALIGTGPAA